MEMMDIRWYLVGWKRINNHFNDLFFHIDIITEQCDKGKELQEVFFLFRSILESMHGSFIFFCNVFLQIFQLLFFHAEDFLIDIFYIESIFSLEIMLGERV